MSFENQFMKNQNEQSVLPAEQRKQAIDKALELQKIRLDDSVSPYKDFGEGERFFIQKAFDEKDNEVVVKVADNEKGSRDDIEREAQINNILNELLDRAEKDGQELSINFPEVVKEFDYDGYHGLVSEFIKEDKEILGSLDEKQREDLVLGIIKEMHQLPIPEDEMGKDYNDRILDTLEARDYIYRWKGMVPDLVEAGYLEQEEAKNLLEQINQDREIIEKYPLVVDHGDLHAGNFSLFEKEEGEGYKVTVMDLESLKLTNQFWGVAQIANRESIAREINNYPEMELDPHIAAQVDEFKTFFEGTDMMKRIKDEFIDKSKTPEEAMKVFTLMRIDEILISLLGCSKNDQEGPYKAKKDIYLKLLKEQMDQLG